MTKIVPKKKIRHRTRSKKEQHETCLYLIEKRKKYEMSGRLVS